MTASAATSVKNTSSGVAMLRDTWRSRMRICELPIALRAAT